MKLTKIKSLYTNCVIVVLTLLSFFFSASFSDAQEIYDLEIDHVMFPVYLNNAFLDIVAKNWKSHKKGTIDIGKQNTAFKGVYYKSKSFYVEYLSNTKENQYWSNSIYVVVPKDLWSYYSKPAFKNEHFLIPFFGCGYQLVSPEYAYLNKAISSNEKYDGFTVLISDKLSVALLNIAGKKWKMPSNGKIKVNENLFHLHDIVVINENSKLIAPILEANPILREYF